MPLQRPFVTTRFVSFPGDKIRSRLNLAIRITDELTGAAPLGRFDVFLKENPNTTVIKNISGYYCFMDLASGSYHVRIEPDIAVSDWYYPVEHGPLEIPFPDASDSPQPPNSKEPVVEAVLRPNPAYPFPANLSLIRASVFDADDSPVVDARVEGRYTSNGEAAANVTKTNEQGEAALYLTRIRLDQVIRDGEEIILIESITLSIEKDGMQKDVTVDPFPEGTMTNLGRIEFP